MSVPGREDGQLVVGQREDPAGVADEGGDVRGQERHAVVQPEDEGGEPAGGDDGVGLVGVITAMEKAPRTRRSMRRVASARRASASLASCSSMRWAMTSVSVPEVNVCPLATKPACSSSVVLDDPVVDEGEAAGAVGVGVGVLLGRVAVGGPAGVPDGRVRADAGAPAVRWRARSPGQGCRRRGPAWPGLAGPPDGAVGHHGDARPSRTPGTRAGGGPPRRSGTASASPVTPMMPHMVTQATWASLGACGSPPTWAPAAPPARGRSPPRRPDATRSCRPAPRGAPRP